MLSTLELRFSPKTARPIHAWFLTGCNPAAWLEELVRCGMAGAEVKLFVVPRSVGDRGAAGVLVIPARHDHRLAQPAGMPCSAIADRLFVPCDAELHPPMSDAEVREICRWPVMFFHPAFGLTGFEETSALHLWDLLEPAAERTENWNFARQAGPLPAPFRGIMVAEPPTLQNVFGEASGDIGSEASEPLPPAPDEPSENPLSQSARKAKRRLADLIAKMAARLPHTGDHRTWLNDLEDWARRHSQARPMDLDRLRNKELNRLLHLLRTDPEAGLRHAIPFNQFAHRGRAPSDWRLGSRKLDLDVNNLGGGGAADHWGIPADLQAELIRQYREAAERELRLGRHRRAAYIYAELLGDLSSAANALKQGGHFREAAVLYEERLRNPLAAAECLAEAGLLHEAIARYEKLQRFLEVADLYNRLGDKAKAEAAVRQVIKQRLASGDHVGAAELLEERLHQPEEAAAVLENAWPYSAQAVIAMQSWFDLCARHHWHDSAARRIKQWTEDEIARERHGSITQLLARLSSKYPDPPLRAAAADLARVILARALSQPGMLSFAARLLVDTLASLAPHDRLLTRDGNRFVGKLRERESQRRRVQPPPVLVPGEPKLLRTLELPREINWMRLIAEPHSFYAVGTTGRLLTVIRGTWDGEMQSLTWRHKNRIAASQLIFAVRRGDHGRVILAHTGEERFRQHTFPANDYFPSAPCPVGTPDWMGPEMFPLALGEGIVWTLHVAAGRAVLSCYSIDGNLLSTTDITVELLADANRTETTHLCLTAATSGAALALGDRLVWWQKERTALQVQLPAQVQQLISTLPHARAGVVALLEHGAVLHWSGAPELIELDRDLACRGAAWTRDGKLVLLERDGVRILDVDSRGVHRVKRLNLDVSKVIAISAGGQPNEFALVSNHGRIRVFGTA